MKSTRRYSHPVNRVGTNLLCDQTGVLAGCYAETDYPSVLRRIAVTTQIWIVLHGARTVSGNHRQIRTGQTARAIG